MAKIKIAIVGVGNCASSLIQAIYYLREKNLEYVPGLLHKNIGNYIPSDIELVAAFDVDKRKVGKDVSEAIFSPPNNTLRFQPIISPMGVDVLRGPTLDGIAPHMKLYPDDERFIESGESPVDVKEVLMKTKPHFLINYLPVGSQKATEYYVRCCLEAGVNFINAIPVFISSDSKYITAFTEKNLICVGDDIKSQLGATIVHRVLADLFVKRGVTITKTYQLNVGGNTDFLNMKDQQRLTFKKVSKTESVQSQLPVPLSSNLIHVGPSDYIPWLKDNKIAFIRIEGEQLGGSKIELDMRLSVEDSPNSCGVMIDVIRLSKVALDRGLIGTIDPISCFAFKHPRVQVTDSESWDNLSKFIKNGARKKTA